MTQVANPYAGSSAFLGAMGQGIQMRQAAERLRLQQEAQAIAQQQAAADEEMRWRQFQAIEAQRAIGNQQWQAEQERLRQQNAADQAYRQQSLGMQGQRFGLDQQRFQYDQQQDQRQRQELEAQRANTAAYRSNLGLQQPGMQGPPQPVDFGALPAGVQSYDIQNAMRQQADDAERSRRWSGYDNFTTRGLWKQARREYVEKAVDDGYPVPDDVKEKNGIFDFAGVQQAYNRGDFAGVAGPLAEAGMPLSASGAASMLERMAPVDPKATQPGPVKFTGAGENAMMVGQQTPLEWNPADPLVSQFIGEARAALTQQIRQQAYQQPNPPGTWLSRRFGSPELRTPEAEAQVQHLAQQMAIRRGFVPTTPGAAPSGVMQPAQGPAPAAAVPPGVTETIDQMILRGATDDEIRRALGAQ